MSRTRLLPRLTRVTCVASLVGASLVLAGCNGVKATSECSPFLKPQHPVSGPTTTLPPSHDNDAGRARAPDTTPDADSDAYQRC
jgi:predicted small secreted protein